MTTLERIGFTALFVGLFALGMAYLIWLDSGCEVQGAMTWNGKVCVEL